MITQWPTSGKVFIFSECKLITDISEIYNMNYILENTLKIIWKNEKSILFKLYSKMYNESVSPDGVSVDIELAVWFK